MPTEPPLPACITLAESHTESAYAQRHTGYRARPHLTATPLWSSVRDRTASTSGVSYLHPFHTTRTLDRGGVCARVVASRPRDVPCPLSCSHPCRSPETHHSAGHGGTLPLQSQSDLCRVDIAVRWSGAADQCPVDTAPGCARSTDASLWRHCP